MIGSNLTRLQEIDLYRAVKNSHPDKIYSILNIDKKNIYNSTFESASFVIGLKDKKTCIEICFAPEMISVDEDKQNPLFNK